MKLQSPEPMKLAKSAGIVTVTLALLLVAKYAFPLFDWASVESMILALVGAFLVNTVKEATGL
jgi:hypothetical protein